MAIVATKYLNYRIYTCSLIGKQIILALSNKTYISIAFIILYFSYLKVKITRIQFYQITQILVLYICFLVYWIKKFQNIFKCNKQTKLDSAILLFFIWQFGRVQLCWFQILYIKKLACKIRLINLKHFRFYHRNKKTYLQNLLVQNLDSKH